MDDKHEDSNRQYPRTINMHKSDPTSRALSSDPSLRSAVAQLLQDEPELYQTMLYFKPPRGRGQALHQDMAIIPIDPLLGVWVPLERASAAVGPMVVVDRSHADGFAMKRDTDMARSFTSGEAIPQPGRERIELEMDPGDALFFAGRTIHGSGRNETADEWRRTFICHFVGQHAQRLQPPAEAKGFAARNGSYRAWNEEMERSGGVFPPAAVTAAVVDKAIAARRDAREAAAAKL